MVSHTPILANPMDVLFMDTKYLVCRKRATHLKRLKFVLVRTAVETRCMALTRRNPSP
jgi:hypothetical protein